MTRLLEMAVYWKLRAICTEVQRCGLALRMAQDASNAANARQAAMLTEIGVDPNTPTFTLNDDTMTLVIPDGSSNGK